MTITNNTDFFLALLPSIHLLQEYWTARQEEIIDQFLDDDAELIHDLLMHHTMKLFMLWKAMVLWNTSLINSIIFSEFINTVKEKFFFLQYLPLL